jgi:ankyrin repeat protein
MLVLAQTSKQELNDQYFEAVRKGDAAAVTALLDKGVDVNAKFRYGMTALFKAAERGNLEVVKILLARGIDVTVKDSFYGATAMSWALDNGHAEVVKLLLDKQPSSAAEVLRNGMNEGKPEFVKLALAKGGLSKETLTASLVAASGDKDKAEIVELLKQAGAVPPPEVNAATLQSYVGKYRSEAGLEINITLVEGVLTGTPTGQRSLALFALDDVTFRPVAADNIVLKFIVNAGKVNSMELKQGTNTTLLTKLETK